MPVREKDRGQPGRREPVPSHVPIPTQTAAKARDFSPAATEGTAEKGPAAGARRDSNCRSHLPTESHFSAGETAPRVNRDHPHKAYRFLCEC